MRVSNGTLAVPTAAEVKVQQKAVKDKAKSKAKAKQKKDNLKKKIFFDVPRRDWSPVFCGNVHHPIFLMFPVTPSN